uniref:Transmembrane protein 94 n=1 Tax=Timema monikensis TaxID=170555 RepID=A0A7R9E3R6_9NEOP|nr:unnamed protein product [Timema monikensis]
MLTTQDSEEVYGLTTKEALTRLHDSIQTVLDEYNISCKNRKRQLWWRDTLYFKSRYTTLCWTSAAALVLNSLALFVAHFASDGSRYSDTCLLEGFVILFLVSVNFWLVGRDNKLRHAEIPHRVQAVLRQLKEARSRCEWSAENYPHLFSPHAPCITLQWTYRDGKIINLPWALLVTGDVIVIRPGQTVPGNCVPLEEKDGPPLRSQETYIPPAQMAHELFSAPTARVPYPNKKYVLQETPYLVNLRLALEQFLDRPVTYYNRLRHLLIITCIEQLALPVTVVSVLFVNLLKFIYLRQWLGHWTEVFLLQPVSVSLPLLPITFPAAWLVLDSLGMARLQALIHVPMHVQNVVDPFEETDLAESKISVPEIKFRDVWNNFVELLQGRGEIPSRSVNLLHVLGSVTALSCADKKGIFVGTIGPQFSEPLYTSVVPEEDDEEEATSKSSYMPTEYNTCQTVAEVLDLTHDHSSPFRLQFDDHAWRHHLNSLKPLGLAILLNTCNMSTHEHYNQFCSHVTCEAIHNEDLVPVINRRCLCELAKQIGFIDHAQDIFLLEEQLSTFRNVQSDMVRRDIKFARSLSIAKLKFPFPHMMAVVVREQSRGALQLMSQGTADIILDSCVEFWDGHDLCPLSAGDRKKVLDFYQRTSLTSYCSAFSYRPLTRGVHSNLSNVYLELPSDCKHLYMPHRSPTPLAWDFRNVLDPRFKGVLGQFHSTDSLLGNDAKDEDITDVEGCFELQCNQVFIGMVTMQYQAQTDMVQLIDELERACVRFVHFSKENELRSRVFSEKMGLESGWNCHISLLSERNRSDSDHLESGAAPCHGFSSPSSLQHTHVSQKQDGCPEEGVGLLQSRNHFVNSRVLSFSAPSAINLEFSQVKFEEETNNDWFEESLPNKSALSHREHESQDSMLMHSDDLNSQQEMWRSLSCLTDSTEQEAPVNFDMSNRAKLPRGIENIRPHLEKIDNVPLLVSLFTDCTPSATRDMLHIMQEYGEVVCIIGSSASAENMPIFLQADASLAVEPLYPQVCQKLPVFVPPNPNQGSSPVDLSRALNSIACSLSFRREDPISIFHLIMESRHYMQSMWNCVQFWMCCSASLCIAQVLGILFMLPPLLPVGPLLWLVCLVIPALSISLVGIPTDPRVMQRATGKNQYIVAVFVLWCYGSKFLPAMFMVIVFYVLSLSYLCAEIALATNSSCAVIYPNAGPLGESWSGHQYTLLTVQHATLVLLVVHFVVISISFVQRESSIWQSSPHHNKAWLVAVVLTFLLQALYTGSLLAFSSEDRVFTGGIKQIPPHMIIFGAFSPIIVFFINEVIKREEIKPVVPNLGANAPKWAIWVIREAITGEFTALTPLHSPPPVVVQRGRLVTQPPPPPANTTHLPLTYIRLQSSLAFVCLTISFYPFSFEAVDKLDNSLQTEFLDLKYDCEAKIIFKQSGYELGWVKIMDTYPQLWGKTEPLLISFPSTYLVEKGFSSVVQLLTKQRNKLDICLKGDLRLNLTNIKPDIQALTEIHQAQGSH